jgi:hypothetical protein
VSSIQPSVPASKLQSAHAGCVVVAQLKGCPAVHCKTHDPAEQLAVASKVFAHDVLQLPQWFRSELVLTHAPVHFVRPLLHAKSHAGGLPEQTAIEPEGCGQELLQTVPHLFWGLADWQLPLQSRRPPEQPHELPWHISLPTQLFVQLPQWLRSLAVSTQAVPHGVGVLDEQRIAQAGGTLVQTVDPLPLLGPVHGEPHAPPTPQPFCGLGAWQVPPQFRVPLGHLHWPLWQVIPPLQDIVQLPQ